MTKVKFEDQKNGLKSNFSNSFRVPPQNVEAERALIGSVMLRPEIFADIIDSINRECFYFEKHKILWELMMELYNKNVPIDLLSLSSRVQEKGLTEAIGGVSYLSELVGGVPSSANADYYAEIVHKKFLMRNLVLAGEFITGVGYDEEQDLEEALDKAEKRVFDVTNFSGPTKFVPLGDGLHEAWDRLDRLQKSDTELRGVSTGFKGLDDKLSGFQKSDLIILAARPSMGKTSLALDIARKSAIHHGASVGIFSLEMSSQQLTDRMLSAESQVDSWKMRTGKGLHIDTDFKKIRDAMETLSKAKIYIDDQPANNILKMRSVCRRLKKEKGLDLIIVDYLQLMAPVQSKGGDNVVQQVTEISRSLKQLAREMEVPVIALSQLSRAVEQRGGKPRLSDLRDSGSIEQDADIVMFIHREDKYNNESDQKNIAEIMIEKHRNGPTGFVKLFFDEAKTSFLDIDKNDFGDFNNASGGGTSLANF